MMLSSIKASLIPVTKYANGLHIIIFLTTSCWFNIFKFHTIGVNQKNNCITIPNNCAKSGTSVVNAGEYYAKVTISKAKYRTLVAYASLVIKKANFKISIPSKDVDYDGLDHEVDIRTSAVAPSVSSLTVTYQLNGETYSSATNVGSYFVSASYTTKDN